VQQCVSTDGQCSSGQGPVAAGTNPTYAAYDSTRGCAYFTNENLENGCVKAFNLSADGKLSLINSQPVAGNHPCYLSVEPGTRSLLTASYVSGHVHRFPTAADGSLEPGSSDALPNDGKCTFAASSRHHLVPHAHSGACHAHTHCASCHECLICGRR
jgi:6-phosphogluconolactonase (cycloisomerase 2 family)